MSDYSSSDVPDGEVLRRNEEARWSSYLALVEDLTVDDVAVLESWDDPEDEV